MLTRILRWWLALGGIAAALLLAAEVAAAPLANAEAGGYRLELLGLEEPAGEGAGSPPAGWQRLAVDFALAEAGGGALAELVPARQILLLEDGLFPYRPQEAEAAAALFQAQALSAGGRIEGRLVFEVPREHGALELRFELDGLAVVLPLSAVGTAEATAPAPAPEPAAPEPPAAAGPPEIVVLSGDWAAPGGPVTVRVTVHGALPDTAWLGVVPSDVPHGDENVVDSYDVAWAWVSDLADGEWTFAAPMATGRYEVRVMQDTAGGPDLAWVGFTVSPAPPLEGATLYDLAEAINVAQPVFGAYALGGENLGALFDGVPADYANSGYSTTAIGESVSVHLDRAYALEKVRFLLWDLDPRVVVWTLEGSADEGASWTPLAQSEAAGGHGWQEVALDGRPWAQLRLTGTATDYGGAYYLVELEAYARLQVPATAVGAAVGVEAWPSRTDLTLALWGGEVLSASSGAASAAGAIDGALEAGAWQAAPGDSQPSLEFAFNGGAESAVGGLALELSDPAGRPRLVELQVTDSASGAGWHRAATIAIPPDGGFVLAHFAVMPARRARLVVTHRYPGANPVALAEVAVLEQVANHRQSVLPLYRGGFDGGLNIATYNLYGQVERVSDQSAPDVIWGMIDGFADHAGWRTSSAAFPQEVVLSFWGGEEAQIGAVSLYTPILDEPIANALRRFEIWTSNSSPDDGFERVGTYEAEAGPGFQIFAFAPRPARFVKLRALSNWGGDRLALSEFEVLEVPTPQRATFLPDSLPPLNDLNFGGHMAVAAGTGRWALLTWWYSRDEGAWQSDAGKAAPIDLVFGFGGTGEASFQRIGLANGSRFAAPEDWVKRVKVYVSPDSPIDNFTQIADLTLQQDEQLQWFDLPPSQGRYVRLRVLENFGGQGYSLSQLVLPERHSAERLSSLARRYADDAPAEPAAAEESVDPNERNDRVAVATPLPLGIEAEGLIAPPTDVDVWRVDTSASPWPGLQVKVSEMPALKVGLHLLDAAGAELDSAPLYETAGSEAELNWALPQGRYHLAIDRPQTSIVVLSDLSPSTDPVRPQINKALRTFVERSGDFEQIAIAGFCGGIDLATDFTSDRGALRQAVARIDYGCGGTDLYRAVIQAIDWLEPREGAKAILLITDGAHYGDHQQSLYAVWDRIMERSARIYAIGYGEAIGWDISPYDEQRSGLLGQTGGDLLHSWADATGGRYFVAPSGEDIERVVDQLGRELRQASRYRLSATAPTGQGLLRLVEVGEAITGAAGARRVEIIFDASGSMWGQIEGRTKIEIAREVIRNVVGSLPAEREIALRIYGHRYPSKPKAKSCTDSELVVPFGPGNQQRIIAAIDSVKPNGQTPIGLSLAWLSEDFRGLEGESQVILVTDGIETCDPAEGDRYYPPAIVQRLLELGYEMSVSVVGFDIAESDTRDFLVSIAETGSGAYFDASNTAELEEALRAAMRTGYEVRDTAGRVVAQGQVGGEPIALPSGLYDVVLASEPPRSVAGVRIAPDRSTWVVLDREGDNLGVTVEEHAPDELPPSR